MQMKFVHVMRASAASIVFGCSIAHSHAAIVANAVLFDRSSVDRSGFARVGHDNIVVDPTIRRYTGMVIALGSPNAQGGLYSFKSAPMGPRSFPLSPNDLRGWRMTVLSGKRFSDVFRIRANTESEITVTEENGPITGLDVNDVFIIESIDANGASMYGPPTSAAPASSPGV